MTSFKLTEEDFKKWIDAELKNRGWKLFGPSKNVYYEHYQAKGRSDYILIPKGWTNPLMVIEAKRLGKDLNETWKQVKSYARERKAPIAYVVIGDKIIKTFHLASGKPLYYNGKEVDFFLDEKTACNFIDKNEYNPQKEIVIASWKQLIQVFSFANNQLRADGLTQGDERFSEFCSILFLKLLSEQEEQDEKDKRRSQSKIIPWRLRWTSFQDKQGEELLNYINNALTCPGKHTEKQFCCFQRKYGQDIFQPLQIKNPAILKRIVDKLTPLQLTNIESDIKGDAFEYFLKESLATEKRDLGQYFTPRHIVDFLVKLANPSINETVYDPFCGTGGILIKTFRHIAEKIPKNDKEKFRKLKKETIFGSEITKTARVAKMNMILTGDGHNNIQRLDSLKNPVRGKFDLVITNMPFSLKGPFDEYQDLYYLGKGNGNSLCIEHCLDAVNPNYQDRRIVLITLEGILFDKKFTKLREYIYTNYYVKYIISLPAGAFKPYANAKATILYLTYPREQKYVWHYTIKNDGYTLDTKRKKKDGENDLDIFWKFKDSSEEEKLKVGFQKLAIEEIKQNNYVSIPNIYQKFDFSSKNEMVNLSELVEEINIKNEMNAPVWSLTRGQGFISQEKRFSERIASENTSHYKIVLPNFFAYDPIRVSKGAFNFNSSQKTGCVSPIYLTFQVKDKKKIFPQYLFCLFQSEEFINQAQIYSFGTARPTLNFTNFGKIKIPVPSLTEQEKVIEELAKIKQNIKNAQQIIDNLNSRLSLSLSLSLMERQRLENWEKLLLLNMDILPLPTSKGNLDILELQT